MTNYSIKNKGVVFFFFFLIVVLGLNAIGTIPKQENPEFPSWNAIVVTQFSGASPQKVEELVTEKIEEKMKEISELDEITSMSVTGTSYVFLAVKQSIYDTEPVFEEAKEKLDDLRGQLPSGTTTPWLNKDFGKTKSFVIAITGDGFENRKLINIAEDMRQDLGTIKYVGRVDITGEQQQRIFLEFSNSRLAELGVDLNTIKGILSDQNILTPGGTIKIGPQNIRIEATGEFKSIEDIKKTVINLPGASTPFFIQDIFTIKREYVDPGTSEMRFMGKEAVGLVVEMVDEGQILELGESIKSYLNEKIKTQYIGVDFHIVNYQPKWVDEKIDEFITNLWQAVLIVGIAMFIMLGWREGFIITILIPFSFLIAILLMQFVGIPIHQISLAAFIIALGMLVDNGIVMTESMSTYIREGMTKTEAAIKSGKELMIPLLAATATTVSAFLPIATAKSAVGIFCESMAWVVGFVLLGSFFVAMTFVPAIGEKILKVDKKEKPKAPWVLKLLNMYGDTLRFCLRFKYYTLIAVIALFLATTQLMGQLGFLFFPPSDRAQFIIDFWMPEGTDYRETRQQAINAEKYLNKFYKNEIRNMALYIGAGGPRFGMGAGSEQQQSNYAQFVVNNHEYSQTAKMVKELPTYFANNYTDATATVKTLDSGPPVGAPIQIQVFGKELDKLYAYTGQIERLLKNEPGTRNVRNDWGNQIPKFSIEVNQDQARRVGVSTYRISQVLDSSFSGIKATSYREGDDSIPVIMRSNDEERKTLNSLLNINLESTAGGKVPLQQVANVKLEWEAGKIRHLNRKRTIIVKAYITGERSAAEIVNSVKAQIADIDFESGYGVTYSGEDDASKEANESIAKQLPLALSLLIMILVAQFANVRKMVIILTTIPLSFIGVILGLLVTGYPFGFLALLGIISLAGIVVNNAILLLEELQAQLDAGKNPVEAIVDSGKRRATPILLTTVTTVSGLFPLAISGLFWGPMAVTIMSGLVASTFLTLVVIPILYAIMFRVNTKESDNSQKAA